ncbi:MAG: phosphatase [Verrucomicrobiota bacterium]|nr:phosphatase [Verrucomicrobiota bacterium]
MNAASNLSRPVVAVVDCGSNSIKVLVATLDVEGKLLRLDEATEETRISRGIGGGSDSPLHLCEEAMSAGVESISRLLERAHQYNPTQWQIVATSAVRDAANGAEFRERVLRVTGVPVRLLSGDEEALGIGRGVAQDPQFAGCTDFQLCDLGGGSLELLDFCAGAVRQKVSLPLGAVRLTERFVNDVHLAIPVEEQQRIVDHVHAVVQQSGYKFPNPAGILAGTGGAITYTRLLLGAQSGLTELTSIPAEITHATMHELCNQLCSLSLDERCALRGLPRKRADIMPAALLTLRTVLELAGIASLRHSLYNLRYGLAAQCLEDAGEISGQGSD